MHVSFYDEKRFLYKKKNTSNPLIYVQESCHKYHVLNQMNRRTMNNTFISVFTKSKQMFLRMFGLAEKV